MLWTVRGSKKIKDDDGQANAQALGTCTSLSEKRGKIHQPWAGYLVTRGMKEQGAFPQL